MRTDPVRKLQELTAGSVRFFKNIPQLSAALYRGTKEFLTDVLDTAAKSAKGEKQNGLLLDSRVATPKPESTARLATFSMISLVALTLGLLAHMTIIAPLHFTSSQLKKSEALRYELANGTAPVGQVNASGYLHEAGTPLAFVNIPKIGVSAVVVEGSTSTETMDGIGHRRDTVLPGQEGISVLYGRQAAYGGVFGRLSELKVGDTISTLTGQGKSEFTVTAIRKAGDEVTNALPAGGSRLTLVSASGIPFLPTSAIWVDAELTGTAKETPMKVIPLLAIKSSEEAMNGDLEALTPIIYLYQLLALLIFAMLWLRRNWGRAQSWVISVPLLVWTSTMLAEQITRILSNLI